MQIIIVGPTGVGKTAIAEDLAQRVRGQIVNADLGQMYQPLTIGTAKPDWRSSPTVQHLFDVICDPVNLDVQRYRQMVQGIIATGPTMPYVIAGGSGFYVHTLFFNLAQSSATVSTLENDTWELLHQIDPQRAAAISPSDDYRIKRALAIWRATGKLPSDCAPCYEPVLTRPVLIHLVRERSVLTERIEQRLAGMLANGWVDEVAALSPLWQDFCLSKKIIGYNELVVYVRGLCSLDQARERIALRTRQYAKRQSSYFRMLERHLAAHCVPTATIALDALSNVQAVDQIMDRVS